MRLLSRRDGARSRGGQLDSKTNVAQNRRGLQCVRENSRCRVPCVWPAPTRTFLVAVRLVAPPFCLEGRRGRDEQLRHPRKDRGRVHPVTWFPHALQLLGGLPLQR